jgi:[acyl-carrier-protein] S-malonyltransferase
VTLALLFSPQGSQAVGMGRELAEASPAARAVFTEADGTLGWSVSGTCWDGPEERLNDTRQTQPCLLTASVAALAALREAAALAGAELRPLRVAGHSVGEYAAVVASGTLAFADALRLVALRGRLMAEAGLVGGMAAVMGLEREQVAAVIADTAAGDVVVANDNAPGQVVISGAPAGLAAVEPALQAAGARRVIPLKVSGPFHSPLMAPVGATLAEAFAGVAWHDAQPPVVSNVTAEPVTEAATIRTLLARQVSAPVEWVAGVRRMVADGVDTFVECGSGSALVGMIRRIAPEARAFAVTDGASLSGALEALRTQGRPAAEVTA